MWAENRKTGTLVFKTKSTEIKSIEKTERGVYFPGKEFMNYFHLDPAHKTWFIIQFDPQLNHNGFIIPSEPFLFIETSPHIIPLNSHRILD